MIDYVDLIRDFTSIIYEGLAFIVLGVVIAGLLEEFVPQQAIAKIIPGNRFLAILLGALLGLIFPMCECGIVVVMRRLLRKGLPLSVCVAYMLAGPVINVIVLGSTFTAFSRYDLFGGPVQLVLLRAGLAFLVAVVTALVVERQFQIHGKALLAASVTKGLKEGPDAEINNQGPKTLLQRVSNISQTALNDFIDIMAFLILGAALAVGGRIALQSSGLAQSIEGNPPLAILLMMLIAVLFCLCSEADAFVAANFPPLWPPAAKMAFMVLGPMMDLKLYLMYTRVFRPRLIWTIITCLVVQVFVYCMAAHYVPIMMAALGGSGP